MRQQVHRSIRAHRRDHGGEIAGQPLHSVPGALARRSGGALTANVVGDDAEAVPGGGHERVPHRVVVGVAVDGDEGGGVLGPRDLDGEIQPVVGADGP